MTAPDDTRCPVCGAPATSRYCPHCGARTGWHDLLPPTATGPGANVPAPPAAPAPAATGSAPQDVPAPGGTVAQIDAPTVPHLPAVARPAPPRVVPEMFATEFLPVPAPAQAWSQAADPAAAPGPATGLFPGWTGMYPAVSTAGAAGVLAPRPERRRKAIYAVLGIAAATVLVLVAALLIAPSWRGTGGTADKIGAGPAVSGTAVGTAATTPTSTAGAEPTSGSAAPTTGSAGVPPVQTVTVTATGTGRSPASSTRTPTVPRTPRTPTAKPTPTARPTPRTTTAPALPLGVPQREIACSGGYIVQLASELDAPRFTARVAALKAAKQIPAGALAADSARSCRIFTSQVNTLVLYAGPFASKYDGCAARLAGPADAFIKGGNADSAREYVSCLCPAPVGTLPLVSSVGQRDVWIGELQRVLGNRLNIDVGDLTGNWGLFTPGTQAAVRSFQQAARLPITGAVDTRTWRALQAAEC